MELLNAYGVLDALANDKPVIFRHKSDKDWQKFTKFNPVAQVISGEYEFCIDGNSLDMVTIYYPKPASEPLEVGQKYYAVFYSGYYEFVWHGYDIDYFCLKRGQVHLTKEAAEAHLNARKLINPED